MFNAMYKSLVIDFNMKNIACFSIPLIYCLGIYNCFRMCLTMKGSAIHSPGISHFKIDQVEGCVRARGSGRDIPFLWYQSEGQDWSDKER